MENKLEFINLKGKIIDNISTIFTEKKTYDKDLINLVTKANDLIKSHLQDEATSSNCKLLYVGLTPIFREIKYFITKSSDDEVVKKDILKQAKQIINVLTAVQYKDELFLSDNNILDSISNFIDLVKNHSFSDKYYVKNGIAIYNGVKRYVELNNNHFETFKEMQNLLYVFEQITNVFLMHLKKPFLEPLLHYSQETKDSIPPIELDKGYDPKTGYIEECSKTVETPKKIEMVSYVRGNDNSEHKNSEHKNSEHSEHSEHKIAQYTADGTLVNTFLNVREAERKTNISFSNIGSCCRERRKSAGGFVWRYIN